MRIAYICQSYPPMISGAAVVAAQLASGVARLGHQVIVFAASPTGSSHSVHTNNMEVKYLPSFYNPLRVGQRFMIWPVKQLKKYLKEFNPDILHIEDPTICGLLAVQLKPEFPNVPYVLTVHQVPWFISGKFPVFTRIYIEKLLWNYGAYIYKHMTKVIVPSKTISQLALEKTGLSTMTITNGINTSKFSPISKNFNEQAILINKYNLDPELPIILFVGRVDEDKRVDLIIEIFSKVIQKVKAQLLIVGDGTKLPSVIDLAKRKGVAQLTHFPGYAKSPEDLPALYRLARTLVSTSLVEIQSMIVLEASSSGIPVVAFDKGSMPEMILNDKTGFLIPSDDLDQFADKLIYLIQHKTKAHLMGKLARKFSIEHSLDTSLKKHITLYEQLLN